MNGFHYCPTVVVEDFDKAIKNKKLSMKPGFIDLKYFISLEKKGDALK
jgi:hypothetical protein